LRSIYPTIDLTIPKIHQEQLRNIVEDIVVEVRNLQKAFKRADGTPVKAIDDVSLSVRSGECIVLLGPSGCGKTTLLRSIAGLEKPDAGEILIGGETMFSGAQRLEVPAQNRDLSMIFQSYALWPHMTAFDNVAFPLRSRKTPKEEVVERVNQTLALVGVTELAGQHPSDMSGGQQQRVALARALVAGDNLILLDEPLSNVDAKVRDQLRRELVEMQQELNFSAIYVTHDQIEAMELADRIAVMDLGKIVQLGSPREIYEKPSTRYVANFVGTVNELPGTVASISLDGSMAVTTQLGTVDVANEEYLTKGSNTVLSFRPERCSISSQPVDGNLNFPGTVKRSTFFGSHTEHHIEISEQLDVVVWQVDSKQLNHKRDVWVTVEHSDIRALPFEEDENLNECN